MIKIVDLSMEGRAWYDYRAHRTQWAYYGNFRLVQTSIRIGRAGQLLPMGRFNYVYENDHLVIEEVSSGKDGTVIYNDDPLPANANEDPYDTITRGVKAFVRGLYGDY